MTDHRSHLGPDRRAPRTIDVLRLPTDGSPDPAADYIVFWDVSAGALKKVLIQDFLDLIGS